MFEIDFKTASEMTVEKLHEYRLYTAAMFKNNLEQKKQSMNPKSIPVVEKEIENYENNLNLMIDLDGNDPSFYNFSLIQNIINYSKQYNVPINIYVFGGSKFSSEDKVHMLFNKKTISMLEKLNSTLTKNGHGEIKFLENPIDQETAWTMSQVKTANQKVDEIVKTIKSKHLSPMEAMAFIHSIATEFAYKENKNNTTISRSLVGVTNTDYIVCVGYSTFVKAIIDKLEMKGLECDTLESTLMAESKKLDDYDLPGIGSGHMQNLIHIEDPKYKVSGFYVNDCCFDSVNPRRPNMKSFANFLFPVNDLLNYNGVKFNQPDDSLLSFFEALLGNAPEKGPNELPVIKEYGKNSRVIDISTLKKCLIAMCKKVYPKYNDKKIKDYVDKIMEDSKQCSRLTFNENATNSFAVEYYQSQKSLNQPE